MTEQSAGSADGLAEVAAEVDWPHTDSERATRERIATLDVPRGGLGRLAELAIWAAGVQGVSPTRELRRVRLVLIGGDHGIAARDVSTRADGRTANDLAAALAGAGPTGVLADVTGVGITAVDVSTTTGDAPRVRRGSGAIDVEDALSRDEYDAAFATGVQIADAEIDAGADLIVLGDVGTGSTTAAATLVSLVTGTEPVRVVGRGSGIDDEGWMRKVSAVRDARRRGLPYRTEPADLLRVIGGADLTVLAAILLRAAARRTPVLLDGVVSAAAALVAREQAPRGIRWWRAAHRSSDPGHMVAVERLRLDPVLDLDLSLGGGAGAVLAVPLLQAAVRLAAELAVDPDKVAATEDDAAPSEPEQQETGEYRAEEHAVQDVSEPVADDGLLFTDEPTGAVESTPPVEPSAPEEPSDAEHPEG